MRTTPFRTFRFARAGGFVLLAGLAGGAHAAVDCAALKPAMPAPTNALQLAPIAQELAAPGAQVGSGVGFAALFSQDLGVDDVVARAQRADCRATAAANQPLPAAGGYQGGGDASAYRFNMTQNGKRMTADEFDAWMKARGIHVVPGPPKTEAAAPPPVAPAPATPPKKKKR